MPRLTKRYQFGRLNLMATFDDKAEFLKKGLSTQVSLTQRAHKWGFFNITTLTDDTVDFLTGYLVKYKPESEEEVADENQHIVTLEQAKDRITAKSRFFLHIKSGLMAFRLIGAQIGFAQFSKMFCQLFEKAHDNLFVDAQIQAIDEKYRIFEVIPRFEYISNVTLHLHPSNP